MVISPTGIITLQYSPCADTQGSTLSLLFLSEGMQDGHVRKCPLFLSWGKQHGGKKLLWALADHLRLWAELCRRAIAPLTQALSSSLDPGKCLCPAGTLSFAGGQ